MIILLKLNLKRIFYIKKKKKKKRLKIDGCETKGSIPLCQIFCRTSFNLLRENLNDYNFYIYFSSMIY